jgi:NAD(P)-dependent dehydrogenase (short-subunit alcohol dehydrogenase family)
VAIITGGATGIGHAVAARLAGLGAAVALASRNLERLERAAAAINEAGGRALAVQTDVRDPEQVERMVRRTVEEYGRVDILVNNAAGNFVAPAEELTPNGWLSVTGIVLNGTFFCSQAAGRVLIRQGYGRILSIGAPYSRTGNAGTIHSAAAKAGVEAMMRTLAVEWARHGICCNVLSPGPVETEGASSRLWAVPGAREKLLRSVPLHRFATVEEIADLATFLVSPFAAYVNGATLVADGGQHLPPGMFALLPTPASPESPAG